MPQDNNAYRPEIDGIRAIAVLAVILFHAGLSTFSGGFLGVDIFFVISGYLITKIIYNGLERGSFSIWHFYDRRIRRIAPALLLVITLSIVPAYYLMLPDDLENFGQSVIATLLFSNNILLMLTSDYFALEVEFKPLMHTWSLGVEEQYYIVIPVLMWLMFRIRARRSIILGISIVSALSFLFCLWASRNAPAANFYLIFSRAWELGAGSLVALGGPRILRQFPLSQGASAAAALSGLAMIIAPVFLVEGAMSLPDWPTIFPVLGVCLIILYANHQNLAGRVLAWRPLVGVGLVSYSAYLFHFPIFAFTRIASLEEPPQWLMNLMIVATMICAYLSWRFVERPFRRPSMLFKRLAWGAAGVSAVSMGVALMMVSTSGFYNNWPELAEQDRGFGAAQNKAFNQRVYRYRDADLPAAGDGLNILVIGNSFARDFVNMGLATGNFDGANISYSYARDCNPPSKSAWQNASRADFVIFGSGPNRETSPCIAAHVARMKAATNARVIVIGTKNFGWNNNAIMLLAPAARYEFRTKPLPAVLEDNAAATRHFPTEEFVNIIGMLADEHGRVPVFTPDRRFISQDRQHLTAAGARFVGSIIFEHPALKAIGERSQSQRTASPTQNLR